MILLVVLVLLQNLFDFGQPLLVSCNETVSKLQLCTLVSDYEQGVPDSVVHKQPTQVSNSVTLLSVAEFNEDQSTILLDLVLWLGWNDSRLSLTPEGPK